jgi:uncharacterized protein YecE (DUF72 family)
MNLGKLYIGCSGWHYAHWRDIYYPKRISPKKWLHFYSNDFNTVEINSSFYRMPSERTLSEWSKITSNNFIFSVKASRFITHTKKLKDVSNSVNLFIQRMSILENKLGPILFQLPPNLKRNDELLQNFLNKLLDGYYYVLEFRHESWFSNQIYAQLKHSNVSLCIANTPYFHCPFVITSNIAYIRLHGEHALYSSSYSKAELKKLVSKIEHIDSSIDKAYVYFNNDMQAHAIFNAMLLKKLCDHVGENNK